MKSKPRVSSALLESLFPRDSEYSRAYPGPEKFSFQSRKSVMTIRENLRKIFRYDHSVCRFCHWFSDYSIEWGKRFELVSERISNLMNRASEKFAMDKIRDVSVTPSCP